MYKKLLYPIKFEEFSRAILSCLANFRKAGSEELILLHVLDVARLPMDRYEGYCDLDVKKLKGIVEAKLEEAVGIIEDAGLRAKKRIEVGVPHREIIKVAREEKVSLIISGRQKRGVLGEIFIGSNTDRIIRYGKIPVYIPKYPAIYGMDSKACQRYCDNLFGKVLFPTDWSDCAENALWYLKGLKEAGIQEAIAVHVMDEKVIRLLPLDKFQELEKEDKKRLEALKKAMEAEGFKVNIHLRIGNPAAELIKMAGEEDVSLIVMGSHGKGYVKGILWGSVSRDVVEYSDRPVLVIKGGNCLGGKL